MKLKKIGLAALAITAVATLASCGGGSSSSVGGENWKGTIKEGFTSLENKFQNGKIDADGYYEVAGQKLKTKNVYNTIYQKEPQDACFNYLINHWTYNSDFYTNMVDGLIELDKYASPVGALAYAYKVEDLDGGKQKWTLQIKEGVKWVNNETGEAVADVKADDFVAALEYVLNPIHASGTISIVTGIIDGAQAYTDSLADNKVNGDGTVDHGAIADLSFDTVGVKAVDDYTIEYTIPEVTPYFLTYLTYSPFLPVNRDFLRESGTSFGETENNILVNGAYRMTGHDVNSKITLSKNAKYWDVEHVYVDKIVEQFLAGDAPLSKTRELYEAGTIDGFTVQATDEEGWNTYVKGSDGKGKSTSPADAACTPVLRNGDATYFGYFNYNRQNYEYGTDAVIAGTSNKVTTKSAAEKNAAHKAILNTNFRRGFLYGLDVYQYLLRFGEDEAMNRLARNYTIRDFVAANGKDYADMVEDVYNREQGTTGVHLTGIQNGSDPIYNASKAAAFFAKAKEELKAAGLTDSDFPIKIDVIGSMNATLRTLEENMYKTVMKNSNGLIDIVINTPGDDVTDTKWGSEISNYDFSMWSGWGPDYADPKTFLHTLIKGEGDMLSSLGLSATDTALQEEILGAYTADYEKAAKITDPTKIEDRYKAFAEAEYKLIYEYALMVPWYTASGYYPQVSKVVPYAASKGVYGLSPDKLKNVIVTENAITQEQRTAIKAAYDNATA